jgi:mannitol/fructose-specific phosphotransferase system IIA component (Ntr-type)
VSEVVAAFGRSLDGIEFESLDNAPVKFIVLFVVPKNQFQVHLRTLAAIAKLLNDKGVRESLAAAQSSEEILQIFENRAGKTG